MGENEGIKYFINRDQNLSLITFNEVVLISMFIIII